jgi:hypothetical protein
MLSVSTCFVLASSKRSIFQSFLKSMKTAVFPVSVGFGEPGKASQTVMKNRVFLVLRL